MAISPKRTYLPVVILNLIDFDEFKSVTQPNKNILFLILGCGSVDLTEGGQTLVFLQDIFPEGTTTRTNLDNWLYESGEE